MQCLNEHDVFEVAAALLKPGGALALDLGNESYDGTCDDDHSRTWEPGVIDALRAEGLEMPKTDDAADAQPDVAKIKSQPPIRAPCSASSLAAAAAAAGLRLAACRVERDVVGGDFFVAQRSMSSSWLMEPFAHLDKHAAKKLRAQVLLDAARRAAAKDAAVATAARRRRLSPADCVRRSSTSDEARDMPGHARS